MANGGMPETEPGQNEVRIYHFEDIWPVELAAIAERRGGGDPARAAELRVRRRGPATGATAERRWAEGRERMSPAMDTPARTRSPDPERIFAPDGAARPPAWTVDAPGMPPDALNSAKMRPQPVPCDARGLAFSGGGIRSAAVCLGALQGLDRHDQLAPVDYLSTVSGGGYIGACLSTAMSETGGGKFPFGSDVLDSDSVAHLRNFSNYLLPRGRSGLRNWGEACVILLRGLVANAVIVGTFLLLSALISHVAYHDPAALDYGNFLTRQINRLIQRASHGNTQAVPFASALAGALLLAAVLIAWGLFRSLAPATRQVGDTKGTFLVSARTLFWIVLGLAFLDLQPILIKLIIKAPPFSLSSWQARLTVLAGSYSAIVSFFASSLGHFLQGSSRSKARTTMLLRFAAQAGVLIAAAVLPIALWLCYLLLAAGLIEQSQAPVAPAWWWPLSFQRIGVSAQVGLYIELWLIGTAITASFTSNSYSLHKFYRDRLSKAFLFKPGTRVKPTDPDPEPLDDLKLSALRDTRGPYHLLNAAMNVEGSTEANRRGRNADFFTFTPDFIGSDLTLFAPIRAATRGLTTAMERADPALDVATAMAISGAAVSANMGANTIRALSPTLALLNVRLGYWLKNPRYLARALAPRRWQRAIRDWFISHLYLVAEMLNLPDETSPVVYLTDGGHIENLGLYELIKRGCETIIVIDAEADPEMAFPSLLKVERFARIDFGVRISLPWEAIAAGTVLANAGSHPAPKPQAPHCAVGRIYYADGTMGTLVYFKASVTGDEKDYILDYKRRNPDFPHETTSDQFFSEEQFEMYRALGFHMVDGVFSGERPFAYCSEGDGGFSSAAEAWQTVLSTVFNR